MSYSKSRAVMTGAPRELRFADGTTFKMRPLRDCDIAEADHWLQARFLRVGRAGFASPEDEARLYPALVAKAMTISLMSSEGAEMMASADGMAYIIMLSCRQDHPGLTAEDVKGLLTSPETVRAFNENWRALNEAPRPTEPGLPRERAGKKSRARRSTAS